MNDNAGGREYAVSALLVFAALAALFFFKLFAFRGPDGSPFFAVSLRELLYGLVIGWAASFACLMARKPALLAIAAAAVIFASFFCYGDRFTAVFAAGAVCSLGSIPFAASLLAKRGRKA